MKKLCMTLAAALCALATTPAFSAWTYSSDKKLSDGNWTFTEVTTGTVNGVLGLQLTSKTAVTADDKSVLDFTDGATESGTETVYPIVSCDKSQLFLSNTTLTQFIAPDMTKVSSQMCQGCTALKKVVLSPDFKDGGSNVFLGCTALDDFSPLDFPKVTGSLGNYFFQNCTSLGGVLILSNATEIGLGQLNGTAFTEVYAPKVTTVKNYGMNGMKNVTKITISGIGGAYGNAIYTANTNAPVSLYWRGTTVPTAASDIGASMLSNGSGANYLRIYCRPEVMDKWLAFVQSVYTSPSYSLRLAKDFSNKGYKDNERSDYPGDGVAEAILREAFSKWCYFWLCNWEYDEPTVQVTIATPDHVEVTCVRWNGELVKAKEGTYKVPTDGTLAITYHTIDGRVFADGTTEYTKTGVTPAANIPAETCDKEVIETIKCNVSVDLAALYANHITNATLACNSEITCTTNGTTVVWTVPGGVAFTLTYTAEEFHYFTDNALARTDAYETGVETDTQIDVAAIEHPVRAADKWEVVTEGNQKYLQNLGRAWKLYITEASNGYTIFRAYDTTVTAVVLAPSSGELDLSDVEDDGLKPVVAVGYCAFSDNHTIKNTWKLTKFIAPKCTSIGTWAFNASASLAEVEISPNATAVFADSAFANCKNLTTFRPTVFPNVTYIGKSTFLNAPVGGDWVLAGVTEINEAVMFNGSANPNGFSVSMTNLTKITGNSAAWCFGSSTLTNFYAPKLSYISSACVFQGCSRLGDIVLSDDITSISYNDFLGCTSLTNLYPTNFRALTTLGNNAFNGVNGLAADLSFPELTTLEASVFVNASKLKSVCAPKALLGKNGSVFSSCSSLTNVVVGGISNEKENNFQYCYALRDVWVTGAYSVPASKKTNMFSPGAQGGSNTCPVIVHVKASTDDDYAAWANLCPVKKSELTAAHEKIVNYKELHKSKILGYVGDSINTNPDGSISAIYPWYGDLCWIEKWEQGNFMFIIK